MALFFTFICSGSVVVGVQLLQAGSSWASVPFGMAAYSALAAIHFMVRP